MWAFCRNGGCVDELIDHVRIALRKMDIIEPIGFDKRPDVRFLIRRAISLSDY